MDKTFRFEVGKKIVRLKAMWSQALVNKHPGHRLGLVPCFVCGRGSWEDDADGVQKCALCLLPSHEGRILEHAEKLRLHARLHLQPGHLGLAALIVPDIFLPASETLCHGCAGIVGFAENSNSVMWRGGLVVQW